MNAEPLWKVADVARFLSMSQQWVYKQAELGTLPCVRFGASLRFDPAEIRRYLDRQKRGGAGAQVVPLRATE
jgi:predicted DNA-binding transcriptional regulator AlpA